MRWHEVGINTHEAILEEPINAFLFHIGASGTHTEQKGQEFLIKGYIPEKFLYDDISKKIEEFLNSLHLIFPYTKRPLFYIKELKELDWTDEWKTFFKPLKVSKDLLILPSWESPNDQAKHVLKIEPGPAFGTGQHPTTQLCLKALESISCEQMRKWSMLDIGTGTGILAIYGAMLGITDVLAIDIDPVALKWAGHNIELNRVSDKVTLSSEPVSCIPKEFDIITANLLLDEIKDVIPHVQPILKKFLIISGILKEQFEELEDLLKSWNLSKRDISFQEDWMCITYFKS